MGNFNGWNFQNTPMQTSQPQVTPLRKLYNQLTTSHFSNIDIETRCIK